jgi:peptidoglycan/xylan/chitin deacetylase (PgdA/CDA1 family)
MWIKEVTRTLLLFGGYCMYNNRKSKIIYYHDLYSDIKYTSMATSTRVFLEHISLAKKAGYSIVKNITDSEGQIAIMFDDGFRGLWDNRDIFTKNNIYPTVFIAQSLVGKEGYLSEDEILQLSHEGWIFESHSVSHKSLWDCSNEEIIIEIVNSKSYVEKLLDKEVDGFCAPKGRFSQYAIKIAKEAGYKYFYSSTPGDYNQIILDDNFVKTRILAQSLNKQQFWLSIRGGAKIFTFNHLNKRYRE